MTDRVAWDWNDVRCFLAVLREGSIMRAAARLGLNQTTCARRIAALEAALGLSLFERTALGYQPTASARALRVAAEALEAAADQFAQTAACEARSARQTIRLTVSAHFAGPVAEAVAWADRIHWVDLSARTGVTFACDGRVYRSSEKPTSEPAAITANARLIADFTDLAFKKILPPPSALQW